MAWRIGCYKGALRRAEKANRSERNKYELFAYWREKAIKAIIKNNNLKKYINKTISVYGDDDDGSKTAVDGGEPDA